DGDDAPQRGDRADGQVDAAGHDDERHPQRHQGVLGGVAGEAAQVVAGRELLAVAHGAEDDEDDERDERALPLQQQAALDAPVGGVPATATAAIASSSIPTPVLLASEAKFALTVIRPTSPARTAEVT